MKEETYDGSSSLGSALANLYDFSPKNQTKIAQKIKQGREAVGIDMCVNEKGKARRLTSDEKIAIFDWHYKQLRDYIDENGIYHYSNGSTDECLNTNGTFLHTRADGSGMLDSAFGRVEFVSSAELPDDDEPCFELDQFKRIAFYTREHNERVRKVVALEFYYLEPLTVAATINNRSVPEWLEEVTDGWEAKKTTTSLTRFVKHAIYQNQK